MQLTEIIVVALIFSISLTLVGSSMLSVRAMEKGLRETLIHTDMTYDLPSILEPLILCGVPRGIKRDDSITDFTVEPCLEVTQLIRESKREFRMLISQPEFRTVLIPYEHAGGRFDTLRIQFANGCTGEIVDIVSEIEFTVSGQRLCPPAPGKARPVRMDGGQLTLRFERNHTGMWLKTGFTVNNTFRAIRSLEVFYPWVDEMSWTYRVHTRRYMVQEPGEMWLRWDLDGDADGLLEYEDEPVFRPLAIDEVDGMVFFFRRRATTPAPEGMRCGTLRIEKGERHRCVVVSVQQPV